MAPLKNQFSTREQLIAYVSTLTPWAVGGASPIRGGASHASAALARIEPITYARTRNYGDGDVTRLSPYIRHGVLSLNTVRNHALTRCNEPVQITKFIQELAWRDFWQRVYAAHPNWAWEDVEPYKTGFTAADYTEHLPEDILTAATGIACIDAFIRTLVTTGYLHNHARMYLAAYIVHFRRIQWQAGARWFLHHLLDGDVASNNLSWQWVASTFSNKPYIFNLENVARYFSTTVDVSPSTNAPLDASYETLTQRLFPNMGGSHA
jgi:deoxyribodipyrimidine photo-lyase